MKNQITTILVALVPLVSTNGQLINPGFEDLGGGLGEGWGNFGSTDFNAFFGPNGHASFFADNPGNSGGVFQLGIAATPGNIYTFELTDFLVEDNFGGNIVVAIEFYEGDDATQISAFPETTSLAITDPAPAPGSLTVTATAPTGAAFVRPLISFDSADGSAGSSENFFVFETSLTAIPEPNAASFILGLSGAILLLGRRRR